ncbi:hypothetical protein PtrSN002B_008262 [Pyrenophora tritici-repentis]|uniref:Herpes-BLLF1 domain containing protein n=2 Tax=Pyrenophora tritici-repentis TaxID=45151 RepID=A0A2W1HEH2_9PLEO|nr:uncharacterized protein PTRG_07504 [Pyrenophora tritici-repentis Pt-1C-BFP]KAA8615098.1 hypothetical protein PtrV1_12128 [Pyrenophora tritici-repentis]EDU50423.1 predicted protein [Pyrenophora tritici-repentis Pt-1C-BFP]KAF7444919.1 hypothetical protein A1F99_114720 [Pyrenophora tritici-repentis]KAF7564413.1 Herpes-BLLF1 domain containing protein [Pyrenophora tritici-repentis]KAG9379160.1 hypothetical protein A1F94_010929 [Pyrenophora tritici-repentis]
MPFITPKKKVLEVPESWDAFPPPPPEADDWQPPEDAIPKPGGVRDARFSQDTAPDGRSKAYLREAKMYSMLADKALSSASVGSTSPAPGLGKWPAPISRAPGPVISSNGEYGKFLSSKGASVPTLGSPNSTSKKHQTVSGTPNKHQTANNTPNKHHTVNGTPNKHQAVKSGGVALPDTADTTTKDVSKEQRSQSPLVVSIPAMPLPHSETSMPPWAARLEKAIAEDTRKASAEPVVAIAAQVQSDIVQSSAPHRQPVQSGQVQVRPFDPAAKKSNIPPSVPPNGDQPRTLTKPATDRLNEGGISVDSHAASPVSAKIQPGTQQVVGVNEAMRTQNFKNPVYETAAGNRNYVDHEHKVKVILIRAMEHELDLYSVATERELMRMSRTDLDRYYEKVFSAHQGWWEAKTGA